VRTKRSAAEPEGPRRSSRDDFPQRERHVLDAVAALGASGPAELRDTRVGGVESEHSLEIGDRNEQWSVGVTLSEDGIDLEHRVHRIGRVDARAVVDDSLEDRQRPEPHATMLADADHR
jgi:hypothetical protein